MTKDAEIPLRLTRDDKMAEEWELVLLSQGLSPSVRRSGAGFVLSVPEEEVEKAVAALSAYETENPPKVQEEVEPVRAPNWPAGMAVAGALLLFFSTTVTWKPAAPWFERGAADAGRILLGELWRAVTALTLHADPVHAAANAVGVALFFGALYGMLGMGLGSALVLLAGAGGNLVNAFLRGYPHVSVGASTAVFGAVGMLGGLGMARRRRKAAHGRRAWVPVAAAFALLALLGTGGERVDIWAHLSGLLIGGLLGILISFVAPRPPGPPVQWAFGCAALALLIYCWSLALR